MYQSEYYHLSLLHNEIKEIKNILSEESVMKIIERRESCEMLKKIISYLEHCLIQVQLTNAMVLVARTGADSLKNILMELCHQEFIIEEIMMDGM